MASRHMHSILCTLIVLVIICDCFQVKNLVVNPWPKSRSKRNLIFPYGSNYIQFIMGIGLPVSLPSESITIGSVGKYTYLLTQNATDFHKTGPIKFPTPQDRKRRMATSDRWDVYSILSQAAESMGLGGKACILQTICETAETPFDKNSGLFEELLHLVFTPSTTAELISTYGDNEYMAAEKLGKSGADCKAVFSDCEFSFLSAYTKIMHGQFLTSTLK